MAWLLGLVRRPGVRKAAVSLFSVVVFALALVLLHRVLGRFDAADVARAVRGYDQAALVAALAFAAASYAALCAFDWLAVRHIGRPLPAGWTSLVSFVSHAVGHNAGFAVLTGGSVRLRMYSTLGLSLVEVGAVIAFAGLTFALGAAGLGAAAFLAEGAAVARLLHIPAAAVTGLGAAVAVGLAAYLGWSGVARRPLSVGGWRFPVPSPGLGLTQMAVAAFDLMMVAGALYVLLGAEAVVSYPAFVGLYVIATLAGTLSHVPGGLGVFEGALAVMLPSLPVGDLLAALLVFRLFYNLLPLLLAALALAVFEVIQRRHPERGQPSWIADLGPAVAAALVFGAGAVLLLGLPAADSFDLPVWLAAPARLLAGAAGAVLLVAAWGLYRQMHEAYRLAMASLAIGAASALAGGPGWIGAGILAAAAAMLAAASPLFPRPGDPADGGVPIGWLGAAAAVVAAAVWVSLGGRGEDAETLRGLLAADADAQAWALRGDIMAAVALATAAVAARGRG
jgi:phosphatidylglycerol lysyltransferase